MQKWEYMSVSFCDSNCYISDNSGEKQFKLSKNETYSSIINNFGRQGWEMINFQINSSWWHYYFKRPIE